VPFESLIIEPPEAEWTVDLANMTNPAICKLRQQSRKRLVDAAEQFVLRLSLAARTAGLDSVQTSILTGDPATTPIVMTGHQPVIFHSGLTFKYQTTEAFAARHRMIAIAIVIDTDEGDAGAFSYPSDDWSQRQPDGAAASNHLRLVSRSATLAQKPSLYSASRLKPNATLAAESHTIENELRRSHFDASATAFHRAAQQYAALADSAPGGFSTMEANLITRWNAGVGGRMLELPLSAICSFPEFMRFTSAILERPFEFAQCYNETLNSFRSEHRIRNQANPFPNLTIEDAWSELPYWIVDHATGTRDVLRVRQEFGGIILESSRERLLTVEKLNVAEALTSLLFAGKQLVPRGALITATLRLLFSDLFVHGTGGGKYDPCTDQLIRNWWSAEPSPFAVASASRFLLADRREDLLQLQMIKTQLRDMQYNPQRFFGTSVFSASLEEQLGILLQKKDAAVSKLKTARATGESSAGTGHEIQGLTDAIKAAVATEFEPRLAEYSELTGETIAAITSRTWPWFMFDEQKT
jgi:hypothetical protein